MFKNVTLEMSLKPFMQTDDEYIEKVCRKVFSQWCALLKGAKIVSIMLWTADGSEILDYKGNDADTFEWCKWIFTANKGFDTRGRKEYRSDAPEMTYAVLKTIVSTIKKVGKEYFPNKTIRVGETFDIGPEFAVSDFKYNRHSELCRNKNSGASTIRSAFLDGNARMKADDYPYAGYPNGVPEGLPFATFLGRQSNIFLKDMGFDFLWLSNGMGFSAEPWNSEGKVFYGGKFHAENIESAKNDVMTFWKRFREECPDIRVETRGTNFTVGIDYSTDAIGIYDLYKSGLNFLPPPNSPWAALDGNYGLEIIGFLSRNAEIPENDYLFRYYLHDPWFKNSPWYDRYDSSPHDIYLPMAASRIKKDGSVQSPSYLNILSIDNSYGTMPDTCVCEPLPHLIKAATKMPDAPPPFVWLYPVKEYTRSADTERLGDMFAGDWFMCDAVNETFPLSGVISTDEFARLDFSVLKDSILVSPLPYPDTEWEASLMKYIGSGAPVILVGNPEHASGKWLDLLGISITDRKNTVFTLDEKNIPDTFVFDRPDNTLSLGRLENGGYVTTSDKEVSGYSVAAQDGTLIAKGKNNVYWLWATVCGKFRSGSPHLCFPSDSIAGGALMRNAAKYFGWDISLTKPSPDVKSPVLMIHRHDNGFFFSTYSPGTTVEMSIRTPYGAPLLQGYETIFDGASHYRFPRSEHKECRVFVESGERSHISCHESVPGEPIRSARRRIEITGLKNAKLRIFPESYVFGKEYTGAHSFYAILFGSENKALLDSRDGSLVLVRENDSFVTPPVTGDLVLFFPDYIDADTRYVKEATDSLE